MIGPMKLGPCWQFLDWVLEPENRSTWLLAAPSGLLVLSPHVPPSIPSVKRSTCLPLSLLPAQQSLEVQLLPFIPFNPGCQCSANVILPAFVGFLLIPLWFTPSDKRHPQISSR